MRGKGIQFLPIYGRQAFKVDGRFKFWVGLTLESWGGGPGLVDARTEIANAADNVSDPTVPWSGTHTMVDLGTIQVELPDDRSESTKKVFDPTRMPEGVRAPLDDVFSLRSGAYAESAARRSV